MTIAILFGTFVIALIIGIPVSVSLGILRCGQLYLL